MRKMYANVFSENKSLIMELEKRHKNHKSLLEALRKVNTMINKASNLRRSNLVLKIFIF